MEKLLAFLRRLEAASIHYTLASFRDSVMVQVTASPAERWEVEFFADGTVEVEVFSSQGDVRSGDEVLEGLFTDDT